ncbi:MAG: glycosyltransferase [Lachnospiraceae bacterium]|nr:glycosyltransferase [Lachnospiraceae bacterium]
MIEITEAEITKNWNYEKYNEPLVAIVCLTYNHELYLSDAIDGFLSQKTGFPFEVYIHDDCSTDKTRDILKQYKERFPNLIIPVYETENQFQKDYGSSMPLNRNFKARKYQAECEGDDYWTDPYKLQKQIDYMEEHEECSLTFTNGKRLDVLTNEYLPVFEEDELETSKENGIYDLNNFYLLKYPPTASHVYRRRCLEGVDDIMSSCRASDLRNRLFLMTKGYAYYFSEETCVYRINVKGSATTCWKKYDKLGQKDLCDDFIRIFDEIDGITDRNYTDSIWNVKKKYIQKMLGCGKLADISKNTDTRRVFREMSMFWKMRTVLKIMMPNSIYAWMYLRDK